MDGHGCPLGVRPLSRLLSRFHRLRVLISDTNGLPLVVQWPDHTYTRRAFGKRVRRHLLFARDSWSCQYCGADRDLTIDHLYPACLYRNRKVATYWENVVTACRDCNQSKADKSLKDFGAVPRSWPTMPDEDSRLRLLNRKLRSPEQREYIENYQREVLPAV